MSHGISIIEVSLVPMYQMFQKLRDPLFHGDHESNEMGILLKGKSMT